MTAPLTGAETIELSTDEVLLLRFTCDLAIDEESAFGPLIDRPEPEVLQRSARSLVEKGLADRRTYRPDRELLRRLLVLSQPDCRIILLAARPGRGERLLDIYGRAGAYVRYERAGNEHRIGPPLELVDVFDEVLAEFEPRRSTGDFIDLRLDALEYFAFSAAASEIADAEGPERVRLHSDQPARPLTEGSLEGAIVMPDRKSRLAGPREEEWRTALHRLADKGAIQRIAGSYQLNGYLHDLALGLASRSRHVVTRIDFGAEDWFVRDATLIHVPGSLFWLRPTHEGGLAIREVDPDTLKRAVRSAIDEPRGSA